MKRLALVVLLAAAFLATGCASRPKIIGAYGINVDESPSGYIISVAIEAADGIVMKNDIDGNITISLEAETEPEDEAAGETTNEVDRTSPAARRAAARRWREHR